MKKFIFAIMILLGTMTFASQPGLAQYNTFDLSAKMSRGDRVVHKRGTGQLDYSHYNYSNYSK